MGESVIGVLLIGGVGWSMFYFLRAMGLREMAGLMKLVCWTLVILFLLQLLLDTITWLEGTRFIQFLLKLMNSPMIGGDGGGGGGGGIR